MQWAFAPGDANPSVVSVVQDPILELTCKVLQVKPEFKRSEKWGGGEEWIIETRLEKDALTPGYL